MEDAADGRWLRTGHLVFLRQGVLMAVAFDLERLEARGQPVPVVEEVDAGAGVFRKRDNSAAGQYDVSGAGWLAYAPGGIYPESQRSLVHVDRNGRITPVTDFQSASLSPRISPDGGRIAYHVIEREAKVGIYNIKNGTRNWLNGQDRQGWPIWTPDGKRVVFSSWEQGALNLYWQSADGSSPIERLTTSEYNQLPGSFTPDGSTLAFLQENPESGLDIMLLDMKSRRVAPVLTSTSQKFWPQFSPDGPRELEHEYPPRFAQALGAMAIGLGAVAFLVGATPLGCLLVGAVAGLQTLPAATGICVGCRLYVLRWWLPARFTRLFRRGDRVAGLAVPAPIRYDR